MKMMLKKIPSEWIKGLEQITECQTKLGASYILRDLLYQETFKFYFKYYCVYHKKMPAMSKFGLSNLTSISGCLPCLELLLALQ